MRPRHALMFVCVFLFVASAAIAAGPTGPREFAPVQDGPVSTAPLKAQWATDHLLVQFTPEGYERASLPTPGDKAAVAARTGLASLDMALDATGVTGLRAAFPAVANKSAARDLGADRWYIFDLSAGADVLDVAARLAADPNVAEALPDLIAFPAVSPNDTYYDANWGHNNTAQMPEFGWGTTYSHTGPGVGTVGFDSNAQSAWNGTQGYGDSSVVIAILDSGVDVGHPDLLQVTGYDFGDNDSNPTDDSSDPGHGTACAGVAAGIADNLLGVAGIAGGCSIMPLKVSNTAGSLLFSSITNAIYYAADNGADVISMSFGAATTSYGPTDSAINYAFSLGVTMLAATGNENDSQISYPAYNAKVIGVGAASPCGGRKRAGTASEVNPGVTPDPNGSSCDQERWWGSNYGSTTQDHQGAVDIIAPTILPTTDIQGSGGYDPGNYSGFFNGTSCATPYAAGVAALIISANPGLSPSGVRNQLTGTAQDVVDVEAGAGWDRYTGYGMVDAATAVGAVINPGAQAAFSASDTTGCAPLTVTFTDQSTGTIDTWLWNFGDGNVSANQNPSHTYNAPGTYNVTLSVTSDDGDDSLTKIGYIVVSGTPGVAFTKTTQFVQAGSSVDFTDASTGNPSSWLWTFGDGGTSTDQNPTYTFNVPGVYYVKLAATNACGTDSLVDPDYLVVTLPPGPTAGFSNDPLSGCAPVTVDFTDESTGSPTSWLWDFGDGTTDTAQSPSHEYTTGGVFDVSLIVTNAGGADTLTVAGAVTVGQAPTAAFAHTDTLVGFPGDATFTDQSTGDPTAWAWDFGDGGTATVQNPVHSYTAAGTYTVSLIASNACGADTLTVVGAVTVLTPPTVPVAAFAADPDTGCVPLPVTFTDGSTGDGLSAWSWTFGDGGTSTAQNPVHEYAVAGVYDVTLIVTGAGGVDTLTVANAVTVMPTVTAAFSHTDTLGNFPNDATFTDQSAGAPTSWTWDFGDGGTSTAQNPQHTYTAAGIYDVTLIASNSCSADTLTVLGAVTVLGSSDVGDLVPLRFGLAQNYPNPFNPSTTFVYTLEQPGRARLEVFDVSGRRLATLVDAHKEAGRHEFAWRPRDLASGVYFSRLTVGNEVDTRRMTLLK